ncbi:MAG: hypothetical protein OXP70_06505, partial [Acidobacteriota bacterium]|nr:hypothetical protein [Acidobacteriota bacterium]
LEQRRAQEGPALGGLVGIRGTVLHIMRKIYHKTNRLGTPVSRPAPQRSALRTARRGADKVVPASATGLNG